MAQEDPISLHLATPGKGPQKSWLHYIGKEQDKSSPADTRSRTATTCPQWARQRRELLGLRRTWEELDHPAWAKVGDEEPYDTIELFFHWLFQDLTS